MTHYVYTLDLMDLFEKFKNDQIQLKVFGNEVAVAISELLNEIREHDTYDQFDLETLEALAFEFEVVRNIEHFDDLLIKLYKWADGEIASAELLPEVKDILSRRCWVATVV